jgi:iron(II)-dependent oxidoreductase
MARAFWRRGKGKKVSRQPDPATALPPIHPPQPVDPNDTDALIEQMFAQGRYALLLRPQIAKDLSEAQWQRASEALKEGMALVPNGQVILGPLECESREEESEYRDRKERRDRVVQVAHFFLDRYPVTNRQFYDFVASGGYEQTSLWDESILPAVLDFVDSTGEPGPRFWKNGCYAHGLERHPVVGVSWHEAVAYSRWVGKRLPTDAEWVKTGSWPVKLSDENHAQRQYPWGDTMDRSRANLWGSGPNRTVPVDEYSQGVSIGGVYDLIGNVWEWTRGNFLGGDHCGEELVLDRPMKSIHGGAFDTYFDSQATCQFQSGEPAISRKHNVGFRCAVGVCDLALARTAQPEQQPAEPQDVPAEEEVSV